MSSRKSLVPEQTEEEQRDAAGAAGEAGEAGPAASSSSSSAMPNPPAGGTGASGMVMNVLNRLFGQAGAADSSSNPPPLSRNNSQTSSDATSMPAHPLAPSPEPHSPFHDPPEVPAGSSQSEPQSQPPPYSTTPRAEDQAAFNREIYRAARNRGDIVELPWSAAREHVSAPYALLGVGSTEDPLLFCHAPESIGDFSMLQMRRVAGREGLSIENGVCCHPVEPGDVEARCGEIMRNCRDTSEHDLD